MELDSKDSEIETLQMKIASLNSETASVSSVENDGEDSVLSEHGTMRLEGWLNVPNKQNIKRHGWKKQYVVVSSKKIIFYNMKVLYSKLKRFQYQKDTDVILTFL